jgi:CSLREA domain-containing protein
MIRSLLVASPTPLALLLMLAPVAWTAAPAAAADISVTTTADEIDADGDCSLREAIRAANVNLPVDACPAGSDAVRDTVILADGATYSLTLPPTTGSNELSGSLVVNDNAAAADLLIRVANDGSATISQDAVPDDTVLVTANNVSLEITDVTIRGGTSPDGSSGGGLLAGAGSLTVLRRCTLRDNVAGNNGGGASSQGALVLDGCVVRDNVAQSSGGGVLTGSNGTIAVSDTLFLNNAARTQSGGAIRNNGALTVTGSSFVDNFAQAIGGAVASSAIVAGGASITGSCVIGNDDLAIAGFNDVAQIATGNWWGAPDGPSGAGPGSGDAVGTTFAFAGFASAPPAGCRPQELIGQGSFSDRAALPRGWRGRKLSVPDADGATCSGDDCSFGMTGDGQRKQLLRTVEVAGSAGDALTFSARSSADGVPVSAGRYFVELRLIHTDGSKQRKVLKFSSGTHGAEARVKTIIATEAYVRVKVRIEYGRASGSVRFDDVSVVLE